MMITLDLYLKQVFDKLGIKQYPVEIMKDGVLYVPETQNEINCISDTFYTVEFSQAGFIKIKSQFYFFSSIKKKENDIADTNTKLLTIANIIAKFRKELRSIPFASEFQKGELNIYRGLTNAWESGIQFYVTFDIPELCENL